MKSSLVKAFPITGCILLAAVVSFAGGAAAQSKVMCRVMTIHASHKEGTTDVKLKKLPLLKKAPFNAYKSFRLLSDRSHVMAKDTPVTLSLPVQLEIVGKLSFKGFNEVLKEINFKLLLLKSKSKEPEEINFAVHGKAPFLYVRPFMDGLLLLNIQCDPLPSGKEGESAGEENRGKKEKK